MDVRFEEKSHLDLKKTDFFIVQLQKGEPKRSSDLFSGYFYRELNDLDPFF